MSDALNFTEIDRQHIELLPARTVLSVFRTGTSSGGTTTTTNGASGDKSGGNVLDTTTEIAKDPFGVLLKLFGGLAKK